MVDTFQGQFSGSWGKAEPGPNPNPKIYPTDPQNTFSWGESVEKDLEPNGLVFNGTAFSEKIGQQFEVGKLTYFNGSIFSDTALESVPLKIKLDLDSPKDEEKTFTFNLDLDTTEDTSDDIDDWSDFVYFPKVLPKETFTFDGKKYTLELTGFSKDGGDTLVNRFRVMEQEADVASLFAKIRTAPRDIKRLEDPTAKTDGAINIGDLNRRKNYRNTDEIGFTEGGVRDLQDFYKFTLSKDSEVDITLDQLKRNANVEILDEDGSTVLFQSTEENRRRENITENLESGDYFIRVYPEGDDRTKYRLGVSADALTDEKDTITTAKELGNIGLEEVTEFDSIGFGRGKNRDQEDYYKFGINEKSDFFLTLDQLKGNANVEVLDGDGSTLLYQSNNRGRQREKINEELEPGDYYVRVIPQGAARTDYRLGLSADVLSNEEDDKEPGISLGAVTDLTPVRKTGKLGTNKDRVDWYNFSVPIESDVNLTLDKLRQDLNFEIYDDGGELIGESKKTGRKAEKIELEGLEAGTYNIKVFPNGGAKSNYRLGITATAPYVDDYASVEEALDLGNIAIGETRVFNDEMGRTEGRSGRDTEDWVSFTIDEESLVDIDLTRLRQNIDMILYDDDGTTILNSSRSKGRKSENIAEIWEEGTYHVQILPKGGNRSNYRFSVNAEPIPKAVEEFTVGELLSLEDGYSLRGEDIGLEPGGIRNVIDRHFFSISDESDVEIDLTGLKRNANIALYDDDGTLLLESRKGGRRNENISDTLDPGDYYVDVEPQNQAKTKYNLDIFASSSGVDPDGGPVPETSLYNDIGNLTENYNKVEEVGFGSGSSRDEVDYYKFELSEEKNLTISLNKLSADIDLELLDSSGSLIKDSRKGGKKNEKIEEELEPGTYYVGVEPKGGARGNYTLNIKVPKPGSSVDDDGGKPPENVTDIGVLTSYEEKDSIGRREKSYRDVNDYRKFTLSAESSVDINLTNLKNNANLQLIDSDGSTVLNTSANGGRKDENINLTLEADDYYVRVFPRGAAKTNYTLNMSASELDDSIIDNEPPGIPLGTFSADPLTQGGDLGFTEGGKADTKDYYSFDITEAGFVEIKLDGLSDNADLRLYDETGEVELGSSAKSGDSPEEINNVFLSADTYVVGVFGLGNQTFYDLSISL